MTTASTDELHARFTQQARWTAAIRQSVLAMPRARAAQRILEVGSGTGAITLDLHRRLGAAVVGIDLDPVSCRFAARADPATRFATGRGEQLPFAASTFDLACCHFLLLWVAEPAIILQEMVRVTAPGGLVLCLAEPDYGGRIEHPETLAALGPAQEAALRRQGADTRMGRRLRQLLNLSGLISVQVGVLGGEWPAGGEAPAEEYDLEWRTLSGDLEASVSRESLDRLHATLSSARAEGSHVLFIPTFYGWGTCPG